MVAAEGEWDRDDANIIADAADFSDGDEADAAAADGDNDDAAGEEKDDRRRWDLEGEGGAASLSRTRTTITSPNACDV